MVTINFTRKHLPTGNANFPGGKKKITPQIERAKEAVELRKEIHDIQKLPRRPNIIVYEYLSWEKFDDAVEKLARQIRPYIQKNTSERTKIKTIYGIPRGGLVLAVALAHKLDFSKEQLLGDEQKITEHTLIVDDISDSGATLKKYPGNMIATLFYHKNTMTMPNFTVYEKTDKWIVYPWEKEAKIAEKQAPWNSINSAIILILTKEQAEKVFAELEKSKIKSGEKSPTHYNLTF